MSSYKGGPGGDKLGIGEIFWYRNDVASEDQAIEILTDRGELFFYRLRRHYLYRAGTLPYDPSAICTKMGYKTVRPFNAGFDELVTAGLVSVEDGMVRFPHADRIIADVQANRDKKANDGRTGGETKAANARNNQETSEKLPPNFDEVSPKPELENEQNQALSSSSVTNNHKPLNTTAPLPPQTVPAKPMKGHVNGGGSKAVQDVIDEHYRLVDEIWGEEEGKSARRNPPKNYELAGEWLALAKGDFDVVAAAMADALQRRFNNLSTCPGTLGACGLSIPDNIRQMIRPASLTAMSSGQSAGRAKIGGKTPWLEVFSQALENGHQDIANHLMALAGDEAPGEVEAANDYAESVRGLVSRKKDRAA